MVIREYIQRYLKSKPKVWGADYRQVPVDKLINEYAAIQQYLLSNCSPGTRVAIGLTRDYRLFSNFVSMYEYRGCIYTVKKRLARG
jgi:hypothetical protein